MAKGSQNTSNSSDSIASTVHSDSGQKCSHNPLRVMPAFLSSDFYWHSYLAGLWESDGFVWIPKTSHAPSGKRYCPSVGITFHILISPCRILKRNIRRCLYPHDTDKRVY
jgi:hypothetical protein